MTHVVNVMGLWVEAPICSVCCSNEHIEIAHYGDRSWSYYCTKCKRDIPAEEVYS